MAYAESILVSEPPSTPPKMGGKDVTRVLVKAGSDVLTALAPSAAGSRQVSAGANRLVEERQGGAHHLEIASEHCGPVSGLLAELEELADAIERGTVPQGVPDVVVLGASSDVVDYSDDFRRQMQKVIELIKNRLGAHVIAVNGSSYDPNDRHPDRPKDCGSLRIHKINLDLIELSIAEGISILDVDFLLAKRGGSEHVVGFLEYSPQISDDICYRFVEILEEYGYFEPKPLVPQLGTTGRR